MRVTIFGLIRKTQVRIIVITWFILHPIDSPSRSRIFSPASHTLCHTSTVRGNILYYNFLLALYKGAGPKSIWVHRAGGQEGRKARSKGFKIQEAIWLWATCNIHTFYLSFLPSCLSTLLPYFGPAPVWSCPSMPSNGSIEFIGKGYKYMDANMRPHSPPARLRRDVYLRPPTSIPPTNANKRKHWNWWKLSFKKPIKSLGWRLCRPPPPSRRHTD